MLTKAERRWCKFYARNFDLDEACRLSECPPSVALRADVMIRVGNILAGKTVGRPTLYNETIVDELLERMADGESTYAICNDSHIPHRQTIREWRKTHPEFNVKYAQARTERSYYHAHEMLAISDDGTNDFVERATDDGVIVVADHEHIQRSKLRVDTRKWILSKMLPRIYGDKVAVEHGGYVGASVAVVALTTTDPQEAAREYQRLLSGDK